MYRVIVYPSTGRNEGGERKEVKRDRNKRESKSQYIVKSSYQKTKKK